MQKKIQWTVACTIAIETQLKVMPTKKCLIVSFWIFFQISRPPRQIRKSQNHQKILLCSSIFLKYNCLSTCSAWALTRYLFKAKCDKNYCSTARHKQYNIAALPKDMPNIETWRLKSVYRKDIAEHCNIWPDANIWLATNTNIPKFAYHYILTKFITIFW